MKFITKNYLLNNLKNFYDTQIKSKFSTIDVELSRKLEKTEKAISSLEADQALKLANEVKIGNATFNGLSPITLSQMGAAPSNFLVTVTEDEYINNKATYDSNDVIYFVSDNN